MTTIILKAEGELEDKSLREWVSKIQRKLDNLNDRSTKQTKEIQELRRKIK